jgi:hypothetical protein
VEPAKADRGVHGVVVVDELLAYASRLFEEYVVALDGFVMDVLHFARVHEPRSHEWRWGAE